MNVLRWGTLLTCYAWSEFYSLSIGFLQMLGTSGESCYWYSLAAIVHKARILLSGGGGKEVIVLGLFTLFSSNDLVLIRFDHKINR
jgi:hypothetical protein